MDTLAEGYLAVRIWVNCLEEAIDPTGMKVLRDLLCVVFSETKVAKEECELLLSDHTILVSVYLLKVPDEISKELFVFSELEVKNTLEKCVEFQFMFFINVAVFHA